MLTHRGRFLVGVLALVLLVALTPTADAQRLPPHRFFGAVSINGQPAPVGATIEAQIGGRGCGTTQVANAGRYVLDVEHSTSQPGCGVRDAAITFIVNGARATQTGSFRDGGFEMLDLTVTSAPRLTTATLFLGDPRPCIPAVGQRVCDATRNALWNGEEDAWRARGVTNPDARFNETVVFRIFSGDPAVIGIIARFLQAPYLQVTTTRFVGANPGQTDEYIEVTNLGGGAQDMTGWSLRSPVRNARATFPANFVMNPGQSCRVYTGAPQASSCGAMSFNATDVWPDEGGQIVLYYDALELLGADTRYSADPNNQPPPPNLQAVSP